MYYIHLDYENNKWVLEYGSIYTNGKIELGKFDTFSDAISCISQREEVDYKYVVENTDDFFNGVQTIYTTCLI